MVDPGEAVRVHAPPDPFVGRGAHKLAAALDRFGVDPSDCRALDAGASTGGFTDCLLQRGAEQVVAVDVGYGQLHERLRSDPRVDVRERCNIRDVGPDDLGGPFGLVVADLSFISLGLVAADLVAMVADDGRLIALVKPQFEAGRREADRGRGVIRDPEVWRRVLVDVIAAFGDAGATIMECMPSPIRGAEGNVEFLVLGAPGRHASVRPAAALADTAVAEVLAELEGEAP